MRKTLFILLIVIFAFTADAQHKKNVKTIEFQLVSPALSEKDSVYITGGIPELGNWNPAAVPMEYIGENTFRKVIKVKRIKSAEYKYTLGNWDKEAAQADGTVYPNFIALFTGDTVIKDTILFWTDKKNKPTESKITGTVKYHPDFKANGLVPRDVIVWLPPGYETQTDKRYPVLYMQDGQNVFDPATASFGVDWRADETADSLIRAGEIEPLIIVGIYCTENRTEEYMPSPKNKIYIDFLIDELKPFIDKEYRTNPQREYTAVGGSSAGGMLAFVAAWEHPEVFSKVLSFSPAFKIRQFNYVRKVKKDEAEKRDLLMYFYNGGIGLEERLQPGLYKMLEALNEKGYVDETDYKVSINPEATHFESAWAEALPEALKFLFGKE